MSRHHRALDRRRWAHVRRLVLDRDGWRCQSKGCGKAGRLEVHHVRPLEAGGEAYDLAGLITYCRPCHFAATAAALAEKLPGDVRAWRRLLEERMGA